MAGAGYKLFNTGDVLTAAQVNTYLQEQVVMVFANAAARTTALSGVLAEGMVSYLKDTDALEIYSGAAWVGYGSGDITGITTGATSGLTGGVTSGTADLKLNTTAKGGLLIGTGSGTVTELAVGTNDYVLTADSAATSGMKWAAATTGGMTLLATGTPSGGEIKFSSISGSYNELVLIIEDWYTSGGAEATVRLNNDTTTANYGTVGMYGNTAGVTSFYKTGSSYIWVTGATGGTTDADNVCVVRIPNYADTNSHKVLYAYTKHEGASNGLHITHAAGAYKSTSAITVVSFYPAGGNMNGTAYLYGVK